MKVIEKSKHTILMRCLAELCTLIADTAPAAPASENTYEHTTDNSAASNLILGSPAAESNAAPASGNTTTAVPSISVPAGSATMVASDSVAASLTAGNAVSSVSAPAVPSELSSLSATSAPAELSRIERDIEALADIYDRYRTLLDAASHLRKATRTTATPTTTPVVAEHTDIPAVAKPLPLTNEPTSIIAGTAPDTEESVQPAFSTRITPIIMSAPLTQQSGTPTETRTAIPTEPRPAACRIAAHVARTVMSAIPALAPHTERA